MPLVSYAAKALLSCTGPRACLWMPRVLRSRPMHKPPASFQWSWRSTTIGGPPLPLLPLRDRFGGQALHLSELRAAVCVPLSDVRSHRGLHRHILRELQRNLPHGLPITASVRTCCAVVHLHRAHRSSIQRSASVHRNNPIRSPRPSLASGSRGL